MTKANLLFCFLFTLGHWRPALGQWAQRWDQAPTTGPAVHANKVEADPTLEARFGADIERLGQERRRIADRISTYDKRKLDSNEQVKLQELEIKLQQIDLRMSQLQEIKTKQQQAQQTISNASLANPIHAAAWSEVNSGPDALKTSVFKSADIDQLLDIASGQIRYNPVRYFHQQNATVDTDGARSTYAEVGTNQLKECQSYMGFQNWNALRTSAGQSLGRDMEAIWGLAHPDSPYGQDGGQGPWDRLAQEQLEKNREFLREKTNETTGGPLQKIIAVHYDGGNSYKPAKKEEAQFTDEHVKAAETWLREIDVDVMARLMVAARLYKIQRRCGALMVIVSQSPNLTRQIPGIASVDGFIQCRSIGQETVDYQHCKNILEAYNGGIAADQATAVYQTVDSQFATGKAVSKVASNPNDILAGNKAAAEANERARNQAYTRAGISSAKLAAIVATSHGFPTRRTLTDKIRAILDANAGPENDNMGGFAQENLKNYLQIVLQERQLLDNSPQYRIIRAFYHSNYKNPSPATTSRVFKKIWQTLVMPEAYAKLIKKDDAPDAQDVQQASLVAEAAKLEINRISAASRDYGIRAQRAQMQRIQGSQQTAASKSVDHGIFGYHAYRRIADYIRQHGGASMLEVGMRLIGEIPEVLMNQDVPQKVRQIMAKNVADTTANAVAGILFNDAAKDIKATIRDAEQTDFSQQAFDFSEDFVLPECLVDPTLPQCSSSNSAGGSGAGGFAGTADFVGGGQGRNSVIGGGPGERDASSETFNSGDPGLDVASGSGINPDFVQDKADKSTGEFDSVVAPGKITSSPTSFGSGEGGGAPAGGGGGGTPAAAAPPGPAGPGGGGLGPKKSRELTGQAVAPGGIIPAVGAGEPARPPPLTNRLPIYFPIKNKKIKRAMWSTSAHWRRWEAKATTSLSGFPIAIKKWSSPIA